MARGGAGAGGPAQDPGTAKTALLAGRYRLESRLSERDGSSVWKATDEVLARPVAVHTFTSGSRRAGEAVAAARAACRLTDPRLVQIFDADDEAEHPYIVTEWTSDSHLGDLLAAGPLGPLRAAGIIAEAADALAAAHAAGLAHLCLTPDSIWCNARGEVKVSGLGISAALTGARAADPGLADTQGLARLLYAAVTGCWPGENQTTLPPAPRRDGRACDPHQVRAGIPRDIDGVIRRALFGEADGDEPPILGPAQLAMELVSITRPGEPLPASHSPMADPTARFGPVDTAAVPGPRTTTEPLPASPPMAADGWRPWPPSAPGEPALQEAAAPGTGTPGPAAPAPAGPAAPTQPGQTTPAQPGQAAPAPPEPAAAARRARALRIAVRVLLAAGVVAVLAAGGWILAHRAAGTGGPAAPAPAAATARLPAPASAVSFDPYGDGQGENSKTASLAIDASAATAWHSQWYTSARFGNLKPGTGLLLDMGRKVTITGCRITLGRTAGASFQVRVGNAASSLAGLRRAARVTGAGGQVHVRFSTPVRGRYVLIWFTRLPPDASGTFQVSVYDVKLEGRS